MKYTVQISLSNVNSNLDHESWCYQIGNLNPWQIDSVIGPYAEYVESGKEGRVVNTYSNGNIIFQIDCCLIYTVVDTYFEKRHTRSELQVHTKHVMHNILRRIYPIINNCDLQRQTGAPHKLR